MKYIFTLLMLLLSLSAVAGQQSKVTKNKSTRLSKEQVARILEKAGFPREIVPVVTCLAEYESNFKPAAVNIHNTNNTKDHGLLQINDIWTKDCNLNEEDLYNPLKNAKCALKIYKTQGLTAWVTYNKFKKSCLAYEVPNYSTKNLAEIIVRNHDLM